MPKKTYFFLLFLILALAAFFRIWQIESLPPAVYPDEAMNGNDAISAVQTGDYQVFYPENNGREGFYINLIALSFKYFGVGIWQLKIISIFAGLLTILAAAWLALRLFSGKKAQVISLLTAFFIATSFWHINFSRIAFRAILIPLIISLALACLYWGRQKKSVWGYALSGAFMGLGFHTYIAFRIAPLILAVPLAFDLVRAWKKRYQGIFKVYLRGLWRWDILILAAILVFLPLGIYFLENPGSFVGRSAQVSIFSSENPVKVLGLNIIKTFGQFNFFGDQNWRHNLSGRPLLFWPVGILFLIGAFWCLYNILNVKLYKEEKSKRLESSWLLLVWPAVMLVPEFMTNEGLPHALRGLGALVPAYLLAALGFWLVLNLIKKTVPGKIQTPLTVILVLSLLMAAPVAFNDYFRVWGQSPETAGAFNKNFKDLAELIKTFPDEADKFVIVNEGGVAVPFPAGFAMPAQSLVFQVFPEPNVRLVKEETRPSLGNELTPGSFLFLLKNDDRIWNEITNQFGGKIEQKGEIKYFKNTN